MASQKLQAPYDGLSKRSAEILHLLAVGMSDREIAERLVMTINTVKWYNRQIYSILGVGSRTQAIARARELQLLEAENGPKPAPAALPVRRQPKNNLPVETTRFIGRKHELERIKELLDSTHLLTLVGPPGTGKTRLALQAAWEAADSFQDGAFFVSLAPVNNPALITNTIASVMGVRATQDQPLLETLKQVLRERHTLLVLDNFEHLLPAATLVSELLSAAPGLKVLATSREPLHLYGEQEYAVPPMALPDSERLDLAALADCESTALFMQQARAVRPHFALTAENGLDIAQICVRLEGLPLAIELAAARTKLLTPRTLLARLGSRLDTLTGGAKDLPARQQTLHNTIEWSYNLLNEGEKMLFARLAVFRGDFSMEAVETICCEGLPIGVFNGLESLVNKSLVQQKELPDGELRFTMLEMLHEYAWERLKETAAYAEIADRHNVYYLELVRSQGEALFGLEPQAPITAIRNDLDNIRQAWHWTVGQVTADMPSPVDIHTFIDGLAAFYEVASLFEEGQGMFIRAAEEMAGRGQKAEEVRCHLLARVAEFAEWRGDEEQSYEIATEVVRLAERLDLPLYRADGLKTLGIIKREKSEVEQAIYELHEAISIYQALQAIRPLAIAYDWLGLLYSDVRRLDEAIVYLEKATAVYAEAGNERGIVFNKGMKAVVLYVSGELAKSAAYQREVLVGYQKMGYPVGESRTANNLGLALLELGDFEEAEEQLELATQLFSQIRDSWGSYNSLGNKGEVHLELDEYDEAMYCFQSAIDYFQDTQMRLLASENMWRLGWLLLNMGHYKQARSILEDCLPLIPKDENAESFAIVNGLLAIVAYELGEVEQALVYFDRAAEVFEGVRRFLTVGRFAIAPRAALLLELGDIEAAETVLAQLQPYLAQGGRNPVVFEHHILQARITAARGGMAAAQQQLEELFGADPRLPEQAAVHFELWRLTNDGEHGQEAHKLYQQLAAKAPKLLYKQRLALLDKRRPDLLK